MPARADSRIPQLFSVEPLTGRVKMTVRTHAAVSDLLQQFARCQERPRFLRRQ
jgi:hypothetical protein